MPTQHDYSRNIIDGGTIAVSAADQAGLDALLLERLCAKRRRDFAAADALRERFHIYMPQDGRISMASLTTKSCVQLAAAIKEVLLSELEHEDEDEDEVRVGEEAAGPPPKKLRA